MNIQETLIEDERLINTKDPYDEGLEIMDKFSKLGDVIVKKNEFKTDGPRKASMIEFMIEKLIDDYSKIVVECRMEGLSDKRKGQLSVKLKIFFVSDVKEGKMMGGVFERYYLSGPMQNARKKAETEAENMVKYVREHEIFA